MIDFIINPHSRSGAAGGIWEKTKKILDELGVVYRVYRTEYPGHASQIAEQLTGGESGKSGRRIVILGGDGTVNEVVNGLAENVSATLAYIPTGSGNDLARSLGIIHDTNHLREAVEKILHPSRYRLLDYGEVSTNEEKKRRFLVSSGIGFDAAVCHNLLHSKAKTVLNKLHLTKLCYIAIGVKQLILTKPVDGQLQLEDGRMIPLKRVAFVSAHIHPYEGGGFQFAPGADCEDGKLNLCVVADTGRLHMVPVLLASMAGKHTRMKGVKIFRTGSATVRLEAPRPVHADGESCGVCREMRVSCVRRKIRVIV